MRFSWVAFLCLLVACGNPPPKPSDPVAAPAPKLALKSPDAFASIANPTERSVALYLEAHRVLGHPRCVNCHPGDGRPRQGDEHRLHVPVMHAGASGEGPPAMQCKSCHQTINMDAAGVPGAPHWKLAPDSMAWLGKSPAELCNAIKDPRHNGERSLAQVLEHIGHDSLVAWGWQPGGARAPAPGDQASLHVLMKAWVDSGAHCPESSTVEGQP